MPDESFLVSVEGKLLLGAPGLPWKIVPLPSGLVPHILVPGHGKALVASNYQVMLLQGTTLTPVTGDFGLFGGAAVVPEGWLCGTSKGVFLTSPNGASRLVQPVEPGFGSAVGTIGDDVVVTGEGLRPHVWRDGALELREFPGTKECNEVHEASNGLWRTSRGYLGMDGTKLLEFEVRKELTERHIAMGMTRSADRLFFATLKSGILTYRPGTEVPESRFTELGVFYSFRRAGRHFLAGTSKGAFVIADPATVRVQRLNEDDFSLMRATDDGVYVVRPGRGETVLGNRELSAGETHPPIGAASAIGPKLSFGNQVANAPDPRVQCSAIALASGTAAFGFNAEIVILDGSRERVVKLPEPYSRLESDGTRFFLGTWKSGVKTMNADGTFGPTIGHGVARLRSVSPKRVILLFANGDVRESDGTLLAKIEEGVPADAAVIEGRLLLLLRRPDAPPVVGELQGTHFVPLELPGLGNVDAESMAVYQNKLYVAGRGAVLEYPPPFAPAWSPEATATWSIPATDSRVELASSASTSVTLVPGEWEPDHGPKSAMELRVGESGWRKVRPGEAVTLSVDWGSTEVTLRAERNMLHGETTYTVFRPYPWWMRVWAWPLHALAFAGVVWVCVHWRTRRLAARAQELERQVNERTASLVRSNASKEEFLATVGHEIRNPLNGLLGIATMLQDAEVGPREKNFLRVLAGCGDQLRSMVDDILDYSRIERGQTTVQNAPLELISLVEQSAQVMDPSLRACSLLLPDGPAWFVGDSGKIRQIVCNLISNALKYGQPREAGIELRISQGSPGHSLVRIAVRNTGPTISESELPHLFDAFKRGSNAGETPGFGLGLAVCRRLADAMRARLSVTSTQGATEFVLELDLPQCHAPEKAATPEFPVSRALAVEDEMYNRLVLGHVLRELGYEVDWAPDGAAALRLAARQAYDLIITDWRLPDFSGDELCRRLQKILGEPKPPIIAVTAYAIGEKFDAARAAGMAGFLTKPVTRENLERLIRSLAGGMKPRRTLDLQSAEKPRSPLGEFAPPLDKLAGEIAQRWAETDTQAQLHDPRAARTAHALRSLLLLAGETDVAEQMGLLEANAHESDWNTVEQLLPFLREEIAAVNQRLKLG